MTSPPPFPLLPYIPTHLPTLPQLILPATLLTILYLLSLSLYRLCLCPQARFPGPRLAALTYWYEYYYDVTLRGQFIFHIASLHSKYGPIVRINPYELHISDPDFFAEIYHNKGWVTHRDTFFNLDYIGEGLAFTLDHDVHRSRREALAPYFSMQSIRALEPRIVGVVQDMVGRLRRAVGRGEVLNLYELGSAFAMDVITDYAFGEKGNERLMLREEMGREWTQLTRRSIEMNPWARQWKGLTKVMMMIPSWVMARISADFAMRKKFQEDLTVLVEGVLEESRERKEAKKESAERTMFHELLFSDLRPQDKSLERLTDEAGMVVGAGGETTAQVISKTLYHVMANPQVLERLRKELIDAIPNSEVMPSITTLQNLPYLCAVVDEGVRISLPVPARSPRVFQDHALQYGKWTIEPGIAVSMSNYMVGTSEKIFPEPFKFKPERWLGNAGKELQKYSVTFGRGRRGCLGRNLAYAELWYCVSAAFRRFEWELFETTDEDVEVAHDFFIGVAKSESKGVRARVLKELA